MVFYFRVDRDIDAEKERGSYGSWSPGTTVKCIGGHFCDAPTHGHTSTAVFPFRHPLGH